MALEPAGFIYLLRFNLGDTLAFPPFGSYSCGLMERFDPFKVQHQDRKLMPSSSHSRIASEICDDILMAPNDSKVILVGGGQQVAIPRKQ